jgi:hypothetical protein
MVPSNGELVSVFVMDDILFNIVKASTAGNKKLVRLRNNLSLGCYVITILYTTIVKNILVIQLI